MTYDDAEWHQDTVGELGLDESAAAIHIGVYLAWAAQRGLLDESSADAVTAARSRSGTPASLAADHFVSQIDPSMLTDEGNRFTEAAYSDYLNAKDAIPEVARHESAYAVPDSWATYEVIAPILDDLYTAWRTAAS